MKTMEIILKLKKLAPYIIGAIVLFGITIFVARNKQNTIRKQYEIEMLNMKEVLIEASCTIEESEGLYSRVVNDLHTSKSLIKDLEQDNVNLAALLKRKKERPLVVTKLKLVPVPMKDTVKVFVTKIDTADVNSASTYSFTSKYPSEDDAYIIHKGVLSDSTLQVEWRFEPFNSTLVVSERVKGVYEVTAGVPYWINVKSVSVNSIPLRPITPKKSNGFMIGVSTHRSDIGSLAVGGSIGYMVDDYSLMLNYNTHKDASLHINKLIRW